MSPTHLANLIIHVAAGSVALAIGFFLLASRKGTARHRRWGRNFCYFALLVCISAAAGTIFFRFIPVFAVLTVLVPYQLISGWRSIYTQALGPSMTDAALTLVALIFSIALIPILLASATGKTIVVYSTLGGLAAILLYDSVRWLFPRQWFRTLWRYEHSYKLISSLFAMLSALVGNVVRVGQPWSQIAPSAVGMLAVLFFFYRIHRQDSDRLAAAARA
jgi:uncharacterized membrane protein